MFVLAAVTRGWELTEQTCTVTTWVLRVPDQGAAGWVPGEDPLPASPVSRHLCTCFQVKLGRACVEQALGVSTYKGTDRILGTLPPQRLPMPFPSRSPITEPCSLGTLPRPWSLGFDIGIWRQSGHSTSATAMPQSSPSSPGCFHLTKLNLCLHVTMPAPSPPI